MITIVDYGLGNLQAFANIYRRLDIPVTFARAASELVRATHIILPGVGAFDWAMDRLDQSGMRSTLDRLVLEEKRPVLGVCVGMQMMARRSDEGDALGLGWFDAEVRLIDDSRMQGQTHLPHMGWNTVEPIGDQNLFRGTNTEAQFYFLHSYFFAPGNFDEVLATTNYGDCFASAVHRDNIYGVQFHPEKSHGNGIQLLKNFAGL